MKSVVLIPCYTPTLTQDDLVSLQQCRRVLSKHVCKVFLPEGMALPDAFDGLEAEYFPAHYFKSVENYNRLMLSLDFYERFRAYDYMLIHQLDAYVFRDELDDWCVRGFDYIGAPWGDAPLAQKKEFRKDFPWHSRNLKVARLLHAQDFRVGNGGFSLRRIQTFCRVLRRHASIAAQWTENEDLFWSLAAPVYDWRFRIPRETLARHFALEMEPRKYSDQMEGRLPFGCHAWDKYDPDFWAAHIPAPQQPPHDSSLHHAKLEPDDLIGVNAPPPVKLSIITINLNHAAGLKNTVKSVIGQTFQDYEFIVIDGGSTDGSLDVIQSHADQFTHWVSEPDTGIYNAMNKGILLARGEYICFLNSGNRFASARVLTRIFSKDEYNEDLLYGNTLRPDGANGFQEWPQPDELTVARLSNSGLCKASIFYKKELFDTLGQYDGNLKIAADLDFNIQVLLAGRSTRHLPFPVVYDDDRSIRNTQTDLSPHDIRGILKRRLPNAVYRDYLRLQSLETDCALLRPIKHWAEQIPNRSVCTNYAMVTYWFWLKMKRQLFRR
ncbi:MAG: DUF5672 family protein, partial [bacterium]